MVRVNIKEVLGSFLDTMPPGSVYYEFSDNSRFAFDADLLATNLEIAGNVNRKISSRNTKLIKWYYKTRNYDNPGTNDGIWVDMSTIIRLPITYSGMFDFDVSSFTSLEYYKAYILTKDTPDSPVIVGPSSLLSVKYTSIDNKVYHINEGDGYILGPDNDEMLHPEVLPIIDKLNTHYSVIQYNVDNPNLGGITENTHIKDDLAISPIEGKGEDLHNCLLWLGGRLIDYNRISNGGIQIPKGTKYLGKMAIGYKTVRSSTTNKETANVSIDGDELISYDMSIRAVKWKGVTLSPFHRPIRGNETSYIHDEMIGNYPYKHIFKIIDRLEFDVNVREDSHILVYNGSIVDPSSYRIINGNEIEILNAQDILSDIINDYSSSNYSEGRLDSLVNNSLPKADDFSVINLTYSTGSTRNKLRVMHDTNCIKNYPYPFHMTFKNFKIGNIVLLDGMFEPYLMYSSNVIRYQYNNRLTRYSDFNVLSDSIVTNLHLIATT